MTGFFVHVSLLGDRAISSTFLVWLISVLNHTENQEKKGQTAGEN